MPCGGIFDSAAKQAELNKTEKLIYEPDFWNQPEKSQKVMQDRKRLEEAIGHDASIASLTSDLDTLFELAHEGEKVQPDIERALKSFESVLTVLEDAMLLSGDNDGRG